MKKIMSTAAMKVFALIIISHLATMQPEKSFGACVSGFVWSNFPNQLCEGQTITGLSLRFDNPSNHSLLVTLSAYGGIGYTTPAFINYPTSANPVVLNFSFTLSSLTSGGSRVCVDVVDQTVGSCGTKSSCSIPWMRGTVSVPTLNIAPTCVAQNSTVTFTCNPVAGADYYVWTLPTGASGTSATNTIDVNFQPCFTSGQVCVAAALNCGFVSANRCKSVYGYNANVSTITGPTEKICGAQDIQYCINPVCGATSYTWNPPPSGLTPMNPTNLNCIDYSVANNVTINNAYITMHANFGGGCIGPTASIGPITGTEIPDPGDISGNRTPNAGTLETYGMPNYCGSYTWSITPGNQGSEWIVSGSTGYNTSIFDVIWLCPGTYFISCTISNCCGYSLNSSSTPATITVSGTPCRLGKPDQQNELSGHTGSTILKGLNGNFIINFDEIPANMIIYDLSGRKISHFENITSQKFEFGAEFAPGVYFANVESENRLREVIKIIKSMSKK